MSLFDNAPRQRWPRSQHFRLTEKGIEAEAQYREMIAAARDGQGRFSYDAARAAWALPLKLEPSDGLCLGELQTEPRTLPEIVLALEPCGSTKQEVRAAVERLVDGGFLDLVV